MATFTVSADQLKNASGYYWSDDRARQGVYSDTRYEGAIAFEGLSSLNFSNISISQIQMNVTFSKSGGDSGKYLTFYQSAQSSISGSIASMRGDFIGSLYVKNAYNCTQTLSFSASENAELFAAFKDYFMAGNRILILYVPKTRGTHSGGYCYDYLGVTAMTLTFSFDYLQSSASLASSSVAAGSAATLKITACNSAYSHRVTWKFGSHSHVQTLAAGVSSASYTLPLSWLDVIPSATSGSASATLETLDTGGSLLGSSSYGFTVTVPSSVVPSISGVSVTPVNSSSVIQGWGICARGKSKAAISITGASGIYGSSIQSYSITTSPSVGSASASSFTTALLSSSGDITVTAKVTDSRGRTAVRTASFYVYPYDAPYFSSVTAYRCTSSGAREDTGGTYVYLKASFGRYTLTGYNAVSCKATLSQVGGSYSASATLSTDTAVILGSGTLLLDSAYEAVLTLTDTVGSTTSYTVNIPSAEYVIHIKKGGKAIGIGMAAADDKTASFGWPLKLSTPLEVSQGGTGANTAAAALSNLGAASASHTHAASAITSGTLPVSRGGTGAADAASARTNLAITPANIGAAASSHNHSAGNITSGTLAAARLPYKFAFGTATLTGVSWTTVDYSSAGFSSTPVIVCTPCGGASAVNGSYDLSLKTAEESSVSFQLCFCGSSGSGTRSVNWLAIGT